MTTSERSGCFFAILKLCGMSPRATGTPTLPYCRKDFLLTPAERSLYGVLTEAVQGRHLIFAKVRLLDLVWLPKGTESRQSHLNRVQSKHVDFVLCDRDVVRPLMVIELDDSSHDRSDRKDRDLGTCAPPLPAASANLRQTT